MVHTNICFFFMTITLMGLVLEGLIALDESGFLFL